MSSLQRRTIFRHRRQKKTGRLFIRRIGRCFSPLLSCFPCVTNKDSVQSLDTYSSSKDDEENDNRIVKILRRNDSTIMITNQNDTPFLDKVEWDHIEEDSERCANQHDQMSSVKSILVPPPKDFDCSSYPRQGFHEKEQAVMLWNDRSIKNQKHCKSQFKFPTKQMSINITANTILGDYEKLKEDDEGIARRQTKQPEMQLHITEKKFICCGADDVSDVEELQELTNIEKDIAGFDEEDKELDLMVHGRACLSQPISWHTYPVVPNTKSLMTSHHVNDNDMMTYQDERDIERILLGANSMVEEEANKGEVHGSSRQMTTGGKSQKSMIGGNELISESAGTIHRPPPPVPTRYLEIQIGTWVGDEKSITQLKAKRQDQKGGYMIENPKRNEREKGKREKKKSKTKKEKSNQMGGEGQTEEKSPTNSDKALNINIDKTEESCKWKKMQNHHLEVESLEQEELYAKYSRVKNQQILDNPIKELRSKAKARENCIGHKISNLLSGLLHDSFDGKTDSDIESTQIHLTPLQYTSQSAETNTGGDIENMNLTAGLQVEKCQNEGSQEKDIDNPHKRIDFSYKEYLAASKERLPEKGSSHKSGMLVIDNKVDPIDIMQDETTGCLFQYCDYFQKSDQRNPEKNLLKEKQKTAQKEEKCNKVQSQSFCHEQEVDPWQRQASKATKKTKTLNKETQERKAKRFVFVQPFDPFDNDADYGEIEEVLTCDSDTLINVE